MSDIHSCSLFCDGPECITAQRDQMRGEIEQLRAEVFRLGGREGVVSKVNARCDHLGMRLGEVIRERDALRDEAAMWEERARHLGWRDEHGA